MSPITGVSWGDLTGPPIAFLFAVVLVGGQVLVAESIPLSGRGLVAARLLTVGLIVPFLVVVLDGNWVEPSEPIRVATLVGWLGGTPVVIVVAGRIRRWSRPDQPPPLAPDRYDPGAGPPEGGARGRFPRLAAVALVAAAIVTPGAAMAISTHTPCEEVEVLLAGRQFESIDAQPEAWMPDRDVPGYQLSDARRSTLDEVAAGRKNPEDSRRELTRDGFVAAFDQRWDGPTDHLEFGAQRFSTTQGALDFQAFATRYACQFANEAFRGPRGSVGLQIRFASGRPIGEQLTWVSGTTRILVFVDFDAPPRDHSRVESLVELVAP
jgi:hypothetical protein